MPAHRLPPFADLFKVGTLVRHPLYPELGHGRITYLTRDAQADNRLGNPVAKVLWPDGQHSRHSLRVLVVAT